MACIRNTAFAVACCAAFASGRAHAQDQDPLDSLIARAVAFSPRILAAAERAAAAGARVRPAGTLPDPVAGVGIANFPVTSPGYDDMTMNTIAVGQLVPYPGKLALQRRAAEHEARAAVEEVNVTRRTIIRDVKKSFYEVAFVERSMEALRRNQNVLDGLRAVSESRYAVGSGTQSDVLKAQVRAAELSNEAAALLEARHAAAASLNALLGRATDAAVAQAEISKRIERAAVSAPANVRFVSSAPGARAADSPLPPVTALQDIAVKSSPEIAAHESMIAAQTARNELSRKAHLPDFDVSLEYGQRPSRPDMVSLMVSVPLPLHRKARQLEGVTEARASLAALQAEHDALANEVRAEVAGLHADLERVRSQLALLVKSIVPQGRAVVESATAAVQAGRGDFAALLEAQLALYEYEKSYNRALADFAQNLAELERVVGQEVLP